MGYKGTNPCQPGCYASRKRIAGKEGNRPVGRTRGQGSIDSDRLEARIPAIKRIVQFIGIPLLLGLAIFLAGPRVGVDFERRDMALPEDLEAHLAERESRFTDSVPGTEATLIWAYPDKRRTPLSIVYLHGFGATRQETAPLSDNLAKRLGANLYYPRLTGHGRSGEAFGQAEANDWLNDTLEAMAIAGRIGERVIVISTSTGGTLATWLETQPESGSVACHVMISPNFGLYNRSSELLKLPWGNVLLRVLIGPEIQTQGDNPEHERYWTRRYPSSALMTLMGLVQLVRRIDLETVQSPVLVVYSPLDTVVDPERIEQAFGEFGSPIKEIRAVTDDITVGNHLLAGRIKAADHTKVVEAWILEFLQKLPGMPVPVE